VAIKGYFHLEFVVFLYKAYFRKLISVSVQSFDNWQHAVNCPDCWNDWTAETTEKLD
jgi:hypothetical protein